ncbi:MAG: DUF6796 family protein [Agathobacter sp.]|nr:DUF6796 family protein [Agathobacter sp.]
MSDTMLAIIGIIGGLMCAVGDLFLDLKGPENKKLGDMKIIDSMWEVMPHYRFVVSTILAMFAVPMYCGGVLALESLMASKAPVYATVFKIIALIGAMGGFMIHTFLNLCPTIYQTIKKEASFELAQKVINRIFKQIYVPFFTLYIMLVVIPAVMIMYAIISGILAADLWCLCLNPIVFQIVGLLLRATKLKCFIDAPSCCAASLGLASYGVLALILL